MVAVSLKKHNTEVARWNSRICRIKPDFVSYGIPVYVGGRYVSFGMFENIPCRYSGVDFQIMHTNVWHTVNRGNFSFYEEVK